MCDGRKCIDIGVVVSRVGVDGAVRRRVRVVMVPGAFAGTGCVCEIGGVREVYGFSESVGGDGGFRLDRIRVL
jgi:hypothetical protein